MGIIWQFATSGRGVVDDLGRKWEMDTTGLKESSSKNRLFEEDAGEVK